MAATSLIPTVRVALFAVVVAGMPAGVQTAYSHPGDAMERETVYLGDASATHDLATIRSGRRTRDETITIDVWVETTADGPDAQAAAERAWVLIAALEEALTVDATLGLPAPFWAVLTGFDERLGWDEDRRGSAARIRATVTCQGRLV